MTLQQMRDIEDNKYIDKWQEAEDEFDEWEKRNTPNYIASYYDMLATLYLCQDENGDWKALSFAEEEMNEWKQVFMDNDDEYSLAKIHACHDFMNGEDMFGENGENYE